MNTYYSLLRKAKIDLTEDEKKQLEKCEAIPPSVRQIVEARVNTLRTEIIVKQQEFDELNDYLNGLYEPNGIPF